MLDDVESPAAPTDWRVATRLPAATPPPLAMAAADIILAAMEEAAIPAPVKPKAPSTTGTAPTARAAGGEEMSRGRGLRGMDSFRNSLTVTGDCLL